MNRYKFQSRPEELLNSDVRVTTNLLQESTRSLEETLSLDPDTSSSFKEIKKTLYPLSASLPLLIYTLPSSIPLLLKHIKSCPKSVLEIITVISREVRQEISPFFPQILSSLIDLCSENLLLEQIFSCISICMKYSIKTLPIRDVLLQGSSLIGHKDYGIRHLASQSFSFLCRKDLEGLQQLISLTEHSWELCYFTINQFFVEDVLRLSWTSPEVAKKLHLSLAFDRKFEKEVWDSIVREKGWQVLRDWGVMCNGSTFPKLMINEVIQILKQENEASTLSYFIKYHKECIKEVDWVLGCKDRFQYLKTIIGVQNEFPEEQVHEHVQKNTYKNKLVRLDLRSFTEKIFEIFNENLLNSGKEVFECILFLFQNHDCGVGKLENAKQCIEESIDNETVWLGLKVLSYTKYDLLIHVKVSDEYILRELSLFNGKVDAVEGENLWTAAFLHPQGIDAGVSHDYLLHPTLRIPACCLLQKSKLFKIANEITKDPTSLSNERHKITDIKRIEHYFSEDPKGACCFLLGLFWERFSTLWKHVIQVLTSFGQSYPDILWSTVYSLLLSPPTVPEYPNYYLKYSQIREWTPVSYLPTNLTEVLISCPSIVQNHISDIVSLFLNFFYNSYLVTAWVPLFPLSPKTQENRPVSYLISYLKVLSVTKSLKKIPQKKELKKIFLGLCCDKNEEIRKLSVECIIKFKEEEQQIKKFLKSISSENEFKEGIMNGVGCDTAIALCMAKVMHRSIHCVSALNFIRNAIRGEFLLDLLPVPLREESVKNLLEMGQSFCVRFLRALKNVLSHCFQVLPSPVDLVRFLLCLYENSQSARETSGKILTCLSISIKQHKYEDKDIFDIIKIIDQALQSQNFRPKIFNLVHIIALNYESSRSLHILSTYLLKVINQKVLPAFIHKALEALKHFELPLNELTISALISAVSQVAFPSNLLSIFQSLSVSPVITPLALRLIKPSVKIPELKETLIKWIPHCEPKPVSDLTKLAMKHEDFILILAESLEEPDKTLLTQLTATRKKGLVTERCYDVQLSALHDIKNLSLNNKKAVMACLSHFVISSELGIRTAAGNAFLSFTDTQGAEEILSFCLKKCKDEEQVRSVLNCWNRLGGPLTHEEVDLSQVLNLGHLQIHRRTRAFGNCTLAPVGVIKKLLIPLVVFYLFKSSSKQNYQMSFFQSLITVLAEFVKPLTWRDFYKFLKLMMNEFENDEQLATRSICAALVSRTDFDAQGKQALYSKILPKLKPKILDKKDKRRPLIRKHVIGAIYKIISIQDSEVKTVEINRLLLILSKEFKTNEETTRDSVVKSVIELIKIGCEQNTLIKEFNHALEPELFALFLTKILKTELIEISSSILPMIHQVLLEYEQYSSYYYIAKKINPKLLPSLFASTKTLQHISQGLSENKLITPEDYIGLGLSLLSFQRNTEKLEKKIRKVDNFSIQPGAATGSRPKAEVKQAKSRAEHIFGIRLLKSGVKKSVELDLDIAEECKKAALASLDLEEDEAVIGALDILKVLGDRKSIPKIISISERAGEEVVIHSLKTLNSLIRSKEDAEKLSDIVLPQIVYSLQNTEMQTSGIKLLKLFISLKVMHELIYDAIEEVPRIILSNSTLTSQICSIYIQFLLTYPLSEKRKNFHLDFLVKNIGCLSLDANNVIIEGIEIILDKLPYEALKDYYDFILLTAITAVSNEEIEEYKEKYLKISVKTFKLNPNSLIVNKIIGWIGSKNKHLHQGCLRFIEKCVNENLIDSKTIKSQVVDKIINSEPSGLSLNFLVAFHAVHGGLAGEITQFTKTVLKNGEDISEKIAESLDNCDEELLEIALESIQKESFSCGIACLVGKAAGEKGSRKVSAVCRKLFGRGLEDLRVSELLKGLLKIIQNSEFDRKALLKTLLVFSKCTSPDLKEILQDIFTELHTGKTQEEFLKEYSQVKSSRDELKQQKKAKLKLRFVSDPELAARLKQKKSKKSKLLKKKKLEKLRYN